MADKSELDKALERLAEAQKKVAEASPEGYAQAKDALVSAEHDARQAKRRDAERRAQENG